MENTKTKAEVLAGVQASIGSIFTKEDVVGIIKSIQSEGGKGITKKQLAEALGEIDLNDYIDKEVSIDHSSIEFTYDTDDNGNGGVIVTAELDESSVENAVEVEVSFQDTDSIAQAILDYLED
jgi:hypothetical protein